MSAACSGVGASLQTTVRVDSIRPILSLRSFTYKGAGSSPNSVSSAVESFREDYSSPFDRDAAAQDGVLAVLPVTVIGRRSGWQTIDLGELWRYRELLFFLAWRDVKVRYKQTVLGAAWAILQPLAYMVVFSLFFGRLASAPSGGLPYPLFVFAGLLPWTFFSNAISSAGQSVVNSQNLVTKIYFPRLIIPLGAVGASLVDFAVAFGLLLAMMLSNGILPGWRLLPGPVAGAHPDDRRPGHGHAAGSPVRRLPRFPLCRPLHGAALDVRDPEHLHAG